MQVKMKVMARSQAIIDSVKVHLPAIQHELLMLLYSQNYDDLQSSEGTQALQEACRQTINQILQSESSLEGELEAVYFTSFIMQ
jgi:flagellar FliL protein